MAKQKKVRNSELSKHKSNNSNNSSKSLTVIPIMMPVYMLDKKIKAEKVTYNELSTTARTYVMDASALWRENKHEEGLQMAIAAIVLYEELIEINYKFTKNEHSFIRLAQNIIDQYKLLKNNKV